MHDVLIGFAVIAAVMLALGVVSGFVRQAPFSMPMIFLGLGLALGEGGFGVLQIGVHDPILEVLAILSLTFVLFLDAINLRLDKRQKVWRVLLLTVGPGTLLTAGLIAGGAKLILGTSWLQSVLLGAVLSSIDPVVLRDVVQDERVPEPLRQELTTEAGANDIIVLPLVLIFAAVLQGQGNEATNWLLLAGQVFVLGPLAGVAVGLAAVWIMRRARARLEIEREYRAIFGVGSVLAAYVAGEAVGGSGFLAILAGSVAVVATDYDLCDCLLEYSEITADVLMPFTFVLFGALLSSPAIARPLAMVLLFAAFVLVVARPLAITLVLRHAVASTRARLFIGWFGPRGLSSLLFALLVVSQGVPGAERLLAITGVVVIVSVVAHGITARPLIAAYRHAMLKETPLAERETTADGLLAGEPAHAPRIPSESLAEK